MTLSELISIEEFQELDTKDQFDYLFKNRPKGDHVRNETKAADIKKELIYRKENPLYNTQNSNSGTIYETKSLVLLFGYLKILHYTMGIKERNKEFSAAIKNLGPPDGWGSKD